MTLAPIAANQNALAASSTFGSALGSLFKDVNTVVQSAIGRIEQAALLVLLNASQQLELTIEGVRNAYTESENKPINRASQAAQEALKQIDTMVKEFQAGVQEQMEDLSERALVLLKELPFSSKQPKVLSIGPTNLIIVAGQINQLIVNGVFPQASNGDEAYTPKLYIWRGELPACC